MQSGTRFALPRNVFPRLDKASIHVSGYQRNGNCNLVVTFLSLALKVRSGWMQSGTRFALPRNVFPRLDKASIHVSGYISAARSMLPFITAVSQKGFMALGNKFLHSMQRVTFFLQFK